MSISEAFLAPSPRRRATRRDYLLPLGAAQSAAQRWRLSGKPSTVNQYAAVMERVEAYCAANGVPAQPTAAEIVAAYLWGRRTVEGVGQASLDADARAIRQGHLSCGLPDPTNHPAVQEALGRKRRTAQALEAPFANTSLSARAASRVLAHLAPHAAAQLPTFALPLEELDPIVEFFKLHSLAGSTRRAYGRVLRAYKPFCDHHGLRVLPAAVDTVCRFLTEYGLSHGPSSLGIAKSAIRWAHHEAGMMSPTDHPHVAAVIKGHARAKGTRKVQKYAFSTDDVVAMCKEMDQEPGIKAIRDRALLLVGFAGAFRRSEFTQRDPYEDETLIYLDFADLSFTRNGVRVTVRKSKTDQEAAGQVVFINYGAREETCPVLALQCWIEVLRQRGINSGPVFRSFYKKGDPLNRDASIRDRSLCGRSLAERLKYWAEKIGLDPRTVGAHSLRSGHATAASQNGASPSSIMAQGRWKSSNSMQGYVRRATEHKDNSSSALGL